MVGYGFRCWSSSDHACPEVGEVGLCGVVILGTGGMAILTMVLHRAWPWLRTSIPWPRAQFSLRVCLLTIALVAVALAAGGAWLNRLRWEHQIIRDVQRRGGAFAFEGPTPAKWMRRRFGLYAYIALRDIERVILGQRALDNGALSELAPLHFRGLSLNFATVTDAHVAKIASFREIQFLTRQSTAVTDAGLEHLPHLVQLRELDFWGANVSDEGVRRLVKLPALQDLNLNRTQVTKAAIAELRQLKSLQALHLAYTGITDDAIPNLKQMGSLHMIDLRATAVTKEGIAELQKALPQCKVLSNAK